MFTGAVGFWPLVELKDWFTARKNKEKFKFSLFSKILVFMHIGLWIFGAIVVFLIEKDNFLIGASASESIFYSLFMSLTTRNAGFSTMDVGMFRDATLFMFIAFMFIGSSPNSAGGGIRTSTFLVVLATIFSFSKSRDQVVINKKGVRQETVMKAVVVIIVAMFVIIASTFLILIFDNVTLKESLFEVASAFGTTGLSLGITSSINAFSKVVLIATMFIGRIGIVSLLLFMQSGSRNSFKYPEVDLIVG